MKGDFARVSFDPSLHYSQVLQQQGRVLLEADWNEQGQIQLQLLRTLVRDLVGPCWAAGSGFAITASTTNADGSSKPLPLTDWQLAPGHFYVDGILCVNEAACTLAQQPHAAALFVDHDFRGLGSVHIKSRSVIAVAGLEIQVLTDFVRVRRVATHDTIDT